MTTFDILVLDDDPDDAFLVTDTLSDVTTTRYRCTASTTPAEALAALAERTFDLLICDYRLGASSGTDFIAALEGHGHDLPSILLTGMADDEADRLALAAGAADFVSKADMTAALLDRTIRFAVANARRQTMLASVINSVTAAICVTDAKGRPTIWNPLFTALAGRLKGGTIADLATLALREEENGAIAGAVLDTTLTPLTNGDCLITMHDVTEHARNAARLDHMARHCALTGLPNRTALTQRLERATRMASEDGTAVTLLNIDLDRFKEVNDVHGHQMGDALLQEAANRMSRACGAQDYVGRLGGDEFLIVCQADDGGQNLANRLQEAFKVPFVVEGRLLSIGASIGLARYPEHGETMGELMSNADIAMFRAKGDAAVSVVRYNADIDEQARARTRMLAALRVAITEGAIDVHYQPQIDVRTGDISGFEALARWHDEELGHVSPGVFIPLAEESGLIDMLGEAVLRRACVDAAQWQRPLSVAVNVSGVQISDPDFTKRVHATLIATGLSPRRLELEVTESVIIEDIDQALFVLRGLKALGIALAVDDFGTGHSSLSTLANFPFDRLKVDRSFVAGIGKDDRLETVVRACIGLGKNLNLDIVAEGVETAQQAQVLAELGCDQYQGYHFGRPANAHAVMSLLRGDDTPGAEEALMAG